MTPSPETSLTRLIVDMDERGTLTAIRSRLAAGEDPLRLMEECRAGMEQVGRMYESGTYFISALIMAGEVFRGAADLLVPLMTTTERRHGSGKVVMATVKGDIHDIGKNIVITLLDAHGFTVVDLGVDVDPERVVRTIVAERPDVLGLSCLLTTGFDTSRETIALARERTADWERRLPVVIGGTAIDQRTADYVGADGWCSEGADGIAVVCSLVR